MERERHVEVDVAELAVDVTVRAAPVRFDAVVRCPHPVAIEAGADALEAQRDEHAEELPVVVRRLVLEDAVQPRDQPAPRVRTQWLPHLLRAERHRHADRGLLDHALVDVARDRSPVLGRIRIGAGVQSADDAVPVVERPAPDGERHDAPERAGEALELGHPLLERGGEAAQPHPGAPRTGVRHQRRVEVARRARDIDPGQQRPERKRIRPRT